MPDDTSPHGGEAMHPLPERAEIPQAKSEPDAKEVAEGERRFPGGSAGASDAGERPPLPDHPERMAADMEDEDADPVVESSPDVARDTGKPSATRQPG